MYVVTCPKLISGKGGIYTEINKRKHTKKPTADSLKPANYGEGRTRIRHFGKGGETTRNILNKTIPQRSRFAII